jgi:lysine-N-methylase
MPRPVKSLPMAQQWDCHVCGECCRMYAVRVTADEKKRIEAQDWSDVPEIGESRIVYEKRIKDFRLNHRDDGSCIFLGPDNRCRIHSKFGEAAKPMACRIYPFTLIPAGDQWRVGMRFACPSVIKNLGRPIAEHSSELREYSSLLEADRPNAFEAPPPTLAKGQPIPWDDLFRFTAKLAKLLGDESRPIETKLREALALAALCRRSRFESVHGAKLTEFLDVVTTAMIDEVPGDPRLVPPPGWAGRMVFRQVAALYSRKDQGTDRGVLSQRGPLGRLFAGMRFAMGSGRVPQIHGAIAKDATFHDAEQPGPPLSLENEALLARFYRIKVESLTFFGPPNFNLPFWDGFDTLALTFPALIWLTRLIAKHQPFDDALALALRTIDDNFGFNPLLGSAKQLWSLRMLAARGDLPKLIAWYGQTNRRG